MNEVLAPVVVYVASQLPKRSETFVYRELLGLRDRGRAVLAVSVNQPEGLTESLGDARLDALAREALVVYGSGWWWRGLLGAVRCPGVLLGAVRDAVLTRDVERVVGRLKVVAQAWAALGLAGRLRGRGVTHVHAHMAHVPTTVGMYLAGALGVPFSFTGHAADLFRDRCMLGEKLRRASFVSCISVWHRGFYRAVEPGLMEERLPVIRCGVPIPPPPEAHVAAQALVPGVQGAGAGGEVLAVGRLVAKKGFDVLIEAWSELVVDGRLPSGWRLTIVGDGPMRGELEGLISRLGLGDGVLLAGSESNGRVLERMRGCDVFALPCREASDGDRDGIPVVLMEAMAEGKPVVCGDLLTIRELVSDNEHGLLVEPGNVTKLAFALSVVLNSAIERRRMGSVGRSRVREEFSLAGNLDRLEAALTSVNKSSPVAG